jgi:hypothetical protein
MKKIIFLLAFMFASVLLSAQTYSFQYLKMDSLSANRASFLKITSNVTAALNLTIQRNLTVTDTIKLLTSGHNINQTSGNTKIGNAYDYIELDNSYLYMQSKGTSSYSSIEIDTTKVQFSATDGLISSNVYVDKNELNVTGNFTTTGNNTLGNASTDTVKVSGRVGINSSAYLSNLCAVGDNTAGRTNYMFNYVTNTTNKLRNSWAEATDTSSFSLEYTATGRPQMYLRSINGQYAFAIDSTVSPQGIGFLFNENSANWNRGSTLNGLANFVSAQNYACASFKCVQASGSTGGGGIYLTSHDGAIMANGDRLGYITFAGATGATGAATSAQINAYVDGAWSVSNDHPGRLVISTKPDGTSTFYERMIIKNDGKISLSGGSATDAPASPAYSLSFGGNIAQSIGIERNTTAATAGNNLIINSGGATSGSTDKNGGDFILSSGISTGTGVSDVRVLTPTAAATGTTDRTPVIRESVMNRYLADNGTFTLENARSGVGIITFGDGEEYAWFSFTTAGVVTLITNSANVTTTGGTNDKLNIYDGGTAVTIENTFAAAKNMTIKVIYNL